MPVLDTLVLDNLEARILAPERLEALLRGLLDRARNKTEVNAAKAKELQQPSRYRRKDRAAAQCAGRRDG
jgi:hypothetical protein